MTYRRAGRTFLREWMPWVGAAVVIAWIFGTIWWALLDPQDESTVDFVIPAGTADRPNAEKMPEEFEINMLRCIFCGYCQEVCPEEAIFLMKDYSLTSESREELIYNQKTLLALGGVHAGIQKWKRKAQEAEAQETVELLPVHQTGSPGPVTRLGPCPRAVSAVRRVA